MVSSEGGSGEIMPAKLPVWSTLIDCFRFVFTNLGQLARRFNFAAILARFGEFRM